MTLCSWQIFCDKKFVTKPMSYVAALHLVPNQMRFQTATVAWTRSKVIQGGGGGYSGKQGLSHARGELVLLTTTFCFETAPSSMRFDATLGDAAEAQTLGEPLGHWSGRVAVIPFLTQHIVPLCVVMTVHLAFQWCGQALSPYCLLRLCKGKGGGV